MNPFVALGSARTKFLENQGFKLQTTTGKVRDRTSPTAKMICEHWDKEVKGSNPIVLRIDISDTFANTYSLYKSPMYLGTESVVRLPLGDLAYMPSHLHLMDKLFLPKKQHDYLMSEGYRIHEAGPILFDENQGDEIVRCEQWIVRFKDINHHHILTLNFSTLNKYADCSLDIQGYESFSSEHLEEVLIKEGLVLIDEEEME
ncbi:hypothetical protein CEW46_28600 [Bacillus cereus]|nr:hypothetical protein CEW46_28600 [Bacillus cereus]